MSTFWERITGSKPQPAAPSPRQVRENLEEELKISRLKRAKTLQESYAGSDYWLTAYSDILARYRDGGTLAYPISQPTDRRYGSNFPFWYSEQQLSLIRAQARMLTTMNPNAQGLLNGLCSYVIGTGFNYKAQPKKGVELDPSTMDRVQKIIDEFCERNAWAEMEQEIFTRSREDGEAFIRLFYQSNGKLNIRTIEPEQIFQPPGHELADWAYGIKTDLDDVFNVRAYYVHYLAPGGKEDARDGIGEEVPSEDVVHIKCNVKRAIKRGLSDFSYETLDAFMVAAKLRQNLGEGAAVQAAIAGIRQHDNNTVGQVETFNAGLTDYSTYSTVTQKETDYQTLQSGSFLDIPKGMNYVQPPGANNSTAHLEIFQSLLRSAGNRHNAPEWLVSADASNNNYASSLTAESPFLRNCLRLQSFYKRPFLRVITAALKNAAMAGRLPGNICDLIDLTATPPSLETRDKGAEAAANQIYATMGVKSVPTIAHELGLDWEAELANQQEYQQESGNAGPLPTDPASLGPDDEEQPVAEAEGGKYSHIDFAPPQGAREAAKRALEVRKQKPASQRGMTPVGIARARDLANGTNLSPETVRRMKAYFDRHESDKSGETWDEQGKGWQAWMGWGGDAGYAWARKVVKQLEAADGTTEGQRPRWQV